MIRPETSYADISTPDKSEEIISLLDEYIDHLETIAFRNWEDYEKQEAIVAALYKFSESLQSNKHDCKYGDKTIHTKSVSDAISEIMGIFGYKVIPIQ